MIINGGVKWFYCNRKIIHKWWIFHCPRLITGGDIFIIYLVIDRTARIWSNYPPILQNKFELKFQHADVADLDTSSSSTLLSPKIGYPEVIHPLRNHHLPFFPSHQLGINAPCLSSACSNRPRGPTITTVGDIHWIFPEGISFSLPGYSPCWMYGGK